MTSLAECVFCFDKIVNDPRLMECGHTCCYSCVKNLAKSTNIVTCTCGKNFENLDADLLEKVFAGDDRRKCGRCLFKPAEVFCVFCQMLLCSDHKLEETSAASKSEKPEHYHVHMQAYLSNEEFYRKHNCKDHKDEKITMACKKCLQVFCNVCETDQRRACTNHCHVFNSLSDVEKLVEIKTEELHYLLSEKFDQLSIVEKEIIAGIDRINVDSIKMQEEVDRIVREQIEFLKQEGERVKAEISQYATESYNKYEFSSKQTKTLKERAHNHMTTLRELQKQATSVHLLENFSAIYDDLNDFLRESLKPVDVPRINVKGPEGHKMSLGVTLEMIPVYQLEHEATAGNGIYYSVNWLSEDRLVTGSPQGIELWDGKLQFIKSHRIPNCLCIIPHKNNLLVLLQRSEDRKVVSLYSADLELIRHILEFKSSWWSQITATDDLLVATGRNKQHLLIWNTNGELVNELTLTDMAEPTGACITSDRCVIVSDSRGGLVRKIRLSDYSTYWECKGLKHPLGITESDTGFFYVCSYKDECIYQLSSNGRLIQSITNPHLTGQLCDLSINKDLLAVACWSGGVKVFRLKILDHTWANVAL